MNSDIGISIQRERGMEGFKTGVVSSIFWRSPDEESSTPLNPRNLDVRRIYEAPYILLYLQTVIDCRWGNLGVDCGGDLCIVCLGLENRCIGDCSGVPQDPSTEELTGWRERSSHSG